LSSGALLSRACKFAKGARRILGERDFPSLTAAASKLAEAKIFIDDSASLTILELRAKARRLRPSRMSS